MITAIIFTTALFILMSIPLALTWRKARLRAAETTRAVEAAKEERLAAIETEDAMEQPKPASRIWVTPGYEVHRGHYYDSDSEQYAAPRPASKPAELHAAPVPAPTQNTRVSQYGEPSRTAVPEYTAPAPVDNTAIASAMFAIAASDGF